jgi:hypothetical protein
VILGLSRNLGQLGVSWVDNIGPGGSQRVSEREVVLIDKEPGRLGLVGQGQAARLRCWSS